ncbi:unnamed protein product [Dovyalis caffra]|uniref:Transmembrane protein n=1 Tax=Dovyalis caffra TaxID=77055 RepID=A0AAV1SGS7_9ROSI|nr:unnamed protein product [Dovyalis caffra]
MHDQDLAVTNLCGHWGEMLVFEHNHHSYSENKKWEHMQHHFTWFIVVAVLTHYLHVKVLMFLPANSSVIYIENHIKLESGPKESFLLATPKDIQPDPTYIHFERSMVRLLKEVLIVDGSGGIDGSCLVVLLWAVLLTLSLLSALIFSCADGVSKDKSSEVDSTVYGGGCAAGCGAACGG